MDMHRINKRNIDTVSFSLIQKYQFSAKFKVKLYYSQSDNQKYYHQTYQKSPKSATTLINTNQYIEVSVRNDSGDSDYFIIPELYRNRFIRKTIKLANALDAYDAGEVDILVSSQDGTKLHSDIAKPIKINLGTQIINITPYFDGSKIMILIDVNGVGTSIFLSDFVLFVNKVKDINYSMMAANLITYHEVCDDGESLSNSQSTDWFPQQTQEIVGGNVAEKSEISELGEPVVNINNDRRKVVW